MGDLTGANKAAKKQAAATMTSANMQAESDRYASQAAQRQSETMLQQDKASRDAAALLSAPLEAVDVSLGSNAADTATVDTSGRRRTARSKFTTPSQTGIKI